MLSVQGEVSAMDFGKMDFQDSTVVMDRKQIRISLKAVNGLLLAMLLSLFFVYLSTTISLSVRGFELRDSRTRLSTLGADNNRMESRANYLNSYSYLKDKVQGLSMVSMDQIHYLASSAAQVAKK